MVLVYILFDAESILHRAKREQLLQPDAGKPRLRRFGSGGKNQLIVFFLKFFSGLQIPRQNRFFIWMDSRNLMADAHVNAKTREKFLWSLKRQILRIGNNAANIIGQTAVGVGNISSSLRILAAAVAPPATPPTITIFI